MTIFWILAAGLALLAVLFTAAPLLAGRRTSDTAADTDQADLNLELFKSQLAELDMDLAAGKLDRTQYEAARRDLEREFLRDSADLGPNDPKPAAHVRLPGPGLTATALVLAVPVSAMVLYLLIGQRDIIPQLELAATGSGQATQQQHAGADGMPPLTVLVQRLEERLQQVPDDGEGWTMLGRTYFAQGRTQDAERALARAHELLPDDTQVTLAYAESIAANNDRDLLGKPAALISEALAAEPDNATARWLSGMVAFQRGQFQSAATAWKRVLDQVDPKSEDADELRQLIRQAEQRAGIPPEMQLAANATAAAAPSGQSQAPAQSDPAQPDPAESDPAESDQAQPKPEAPTGSAVPSEAPASTTQQTAQPDAGGVPSQLAQGQPPAGGESAAAAAEPSTNAAGQGDAAPGLEVSVSLAPELAGRMPPSTTVFVFARAAAGPPMPLAVQQLRLADLPATVRLDDSMAMMPTMQLSSFPQVVVGARVSPSGQAMPQPGDLEGATGPVSSADAGAVSVTIDRVRR
ncbi:c-type cytochrome biogenesis protein CcmI [Thiohalocapsa halophila]|uniref:C-type cytochrome biogenesis protein CcmI n=1 Tax=Thiohalocapsa halophila TaxID=69359 RepID=A0ABS1CJS6_9GAMM|nr:c-type cytochrome biogenesis protein CcmI [Thiohalocapsa halophila]MBK1632147.1 c-type cytochrome biogenesis protein CcmI [Thiohalocapsa halophila]